jgi:hypothetical protein
MLRIYSADIGAVPTSVTLIMLRDKTVEVAVEVLQNEPNMLEQLEQKPTGEQCADDSCVQTTYTAMDESETGDSDDELSTGSQIGDELESLRDEKSQQGETKRQDDRCHDCGSDHYKECGCYLRRVDTGTEESVASDDGEEQGIDSRAVSEA